MKILLCAVTLILFGCSGGPEIAGSGSESPNALTGKTLRLSDGIAPSSKALPVVNALIRLYAVRETSTDTASPRYSWSLVDSSRTDASGSFSLLNPAPGQFSVICEKDSLKAFSGYFTFQDDSLDLGNLMLSSAPNLAGSLRDSSGQPVSGVALGLVGTPFLDTTATDGRFAFKQVPEGIYNFSLLFPWEKLGGDSLALTTAAPVKAPSPAVTTIDSTQWGIVLADTVGFDSIAGNLSVTWPVRVVSFFSFLPDDAVRLSVSSYSISYSVTKP